MPWVSSTIHGLSMRPRRRVTSTMSPVSPMPPTVARNSSRSRSGPHSTRRPSAVQSDRRSTNAPNEPSR